MNESLKGPRFEKPVERRDFLGLMAIGSFFVTMFVAILGALKLPVPAVFPETDSRFPVGRPEDFPPGSKTHMPRRRLWVISNADGVAALSTICPHLGCVVTPEDGGGYTCPCHGSRFDDGGEVKGGPSPRGLMWVEVSLGPDGRLVVDSEREVTPDTRFKV